jgi:hypothetical protein
MRCIKFNGGFYMFRTLLLIVSAFVSTSALAADLSKNAATYDGLYAHDLVQRPEIRSIMAQTGGALAVIDRYSTASPGSVTNGRFLTFDGCMPHSCNMDGYVAVIDLKTGAMSIVFSVKEFMSDKTVVIQQSNDAWVSQKLSIVSIPMNIANELMNFAAGIEAANQ